MDADTQSRSMAPVPREEDIKTTGLAFRNTKNTIVPRERKMFGFLNSVASVIISYIRTPQENRDNIDPMLLFGVLNKEIEKAKNLIADDEHWCALLGGLEKKENCDDPAEALKICHAILWELDHAEPEFIAAILDQNEVYKHWPKTGT